MQLFIGYIIFSNIVGYAVMRQDKKKAIRKKRRIPNKTLWLCAFLGGSIGCYIAMKIHRHKTKQQAFSLGLPVVGCIQILMGMLLLS